LPPCKDRAYTLNGSHWRKTLVWRFDARSTPKNLGRRATVRSLRLAARTVARGTNRCGMSPSLDSHARYAGQTTAAPDVRRDGSCGTPDGRNEVGFGILPSTEMALTCYWSRNGGTIESDMVFNRTDY